MRNSLSIPARTALTAGLSVMPVTLLLVGSGTVRADPGLTMTLDLSQQLELSENPSNVSRDGLRAVTNLGFGLVSVTRSQQLRFQTSTGLSYNFDSAGSADGIEIESPAVSLGYNLISKNAELSLRGSYSEVDLQDAVFLVDPDTDEIEIATGGTRETIAVNTGLTLWRTGPANLELSHSYREVNYSGTSGATTNDSTTDSLRATVRLRFSPTVAGRVFATASTTDEEGRGAVDTDRASFGVGTDYQIDRLTSLSAQVSYQENRATDARGTRVTDGLGFNVSATRSLKNGDLTFALSQSQTDNGARGQIRVGRSLSLHRTDLSFSLGATRTDGFSAQPLASFSLAHVLDKRSTFNMALSQTATTSTGDAEAVATRLSISYARSLSKVSSLTTGIQLVNQDLLGSTAGDETSARFNLTYNHAVGNDWGLVSGYSFTTTRRDGVPDEDTSRLFVGLQKSFSFRP